MALDSSSISLADWANGANDPLVTKITMSLYETCNILQDIPFSTVPSMKMTGVRYLNNAGMPTVGWRRLNEAPANAHGRPTPYEEQAFILSNTFNIDTVLLADENAIEDPIDTQIRAYMAQAAYECNYRFLLNDPTDPTNGEPDAWAGLKYRLDNTSQYSIPSEMKINGFEGGGTTIDLSGTITAANANLFIETVDYLLTLMGAESGEGVVLYMNDIMKRRFAAAIRALGQGGGWSSVKDAFNRRVNVYNDAKVRDVGRRPDGTLNMVRILGNETSGGASTTGSVTYTSIYAARYGEGSFKAWQMKPLKPVNLGVDPTNGTQVNVVVDWPCGLWQPNNRSIGRIFNIKVN